MVFSPDCHLNKLQRIQNAAARLVCQQSRYCHITPLLFNLHWLPVKFRIVFKILLITFKALKGLAPTYVASLISIESPSRYNLRSSCDTLILSCPKKLSKVTLGDRSFTYAAPKLWNALPLDIRSESTVAGFKSKPRENEVRERIPHTCPSSYDNFFQSIFVSASCGVVILMSTCYWSVRVTSFNFKLCGDPKMLYRS